MKGIGLFIVILISCAQVFAQNKNVFESAVDYCNCKITLAYLEFLTSKPKANLADKASFDKIKPSFGDCSIGSSINYDALSKLLAGNDFNITSQNISAVIDHIKTLYKDGITQQQAETMIVNGILEIEALKKALPLSDDRWLKLQGTLTDYLSKNWKPSSDSNPDSPLNASGTGASGEKVGIIQRAFQNIPLLLIIIVVAICIWIGINIYPKGNKKAGQEGDVDKEIKSLLGSLGDKYDTILAELKLLKRPEGNDVNATGMKLTSSEWIAFKTAVETQMDGMRIAIEKMQIDVAKLNIPPSPGLGKPETRVETVEDSNQSHSRNVFYASAPNKEGSYFNASGISKTPSPTASFYKFTMESNEQRASFVFHNDDRSVKDAINAPDRILRPVCKILNNRNQNARRINTRTPGIVYRQNDKWMLDTPAEVEYE